MVFYLFDRNPTSNNLKVWLRWQKTGGRGPKILWKNLEDMVESFRDRVAIEVEASVLHTTDANHLWSTMAQLIKKVVNILLEIVM